MPLKDTLTSLLSPGQTGSDFKPLNTPEEWRPRLDIEDGKGGYIVTQARPVGNSPDAETVLREFGLDPETWTVSSLRRSKWQTFSGEWLEAYRVNVLPASNARSEQLDVEKLIDEIKKWRPSKEKTSTGTGAYSLFPSDQQIGKRSGEVGTETTVERILYLNDASVQKFRGLKKYGLGFGTIFLGLPGDHVEGITSQNGRLQGQAASDMGLTEQIRIARRLLLAQIKSHAPLAERMIVAIVNGNHDEVTRQVVVDPAEGWNTEIASSVQDICAENPALAHVEFRFPSPGNQTLAVDVDGTLVGMFHGHQAPSNNVAKYLYGQATGQTAIGNADVWVSGHYHNFRTMDVGNRLWVQCPTVDPGSDWFRDRSGMESKPGLLTMALGGSFDPREFISVIPVEK